MINFADIIKKSFLNEFSTSLTIDRIALSLCLAFVLGLFIVWVYKLTYIGVMFNKSYAFSLVLLSMVTSMIIMTISTNLTLSLGMVGALSIVRFRTAVKESNDTVFMFWAISAGIMTGAGFTYISVICTVLLGVLYYVLYLLGVRFTASPYLLIIRYTPEEKINVEAALKMLPKFKVKSKTFTKKGVELALEIRLDKKSLEKIEELNALEGVLDVSAISTKGDTVL